MQEGQTHTEVIDGEGVIEIAKCAPTMEGFSRHIPINVRTLYTCRSTTPTYSVTSSDYLTSITLATNESYIHSKSILSTL